jgi:hypothetical protein
MRALRAPAAAALASLALYAGAGTAYADEAKLPVVRHLAYRLSVGWTGRTQEHREDGLQAIRPGPGAARQNDSLTVGTRTFEEGRIIADVVAATLDGGLVVDISEEAQTRTRRVVRVGIHSNGRLDYPPDAEMSEEEGFLLRLLARGIAPSHIEEGSTWNVDESGADYVWRTNFRAVEIRASDDVRLEMQSSLTSHGVGGVTVSSSGKVAYDPTRDVPLSMELDTKALRQTATAVTTTDLAISLELLEDSFRNANR